MANWLYEGNSSQQSIPASLWTCFLTMPQTVRAFTSSISSARTCALRSRTPINIALLDEPRPPCICFAETPFFLYMYFLFCQKVPKSVCGPQLDSFQRQLPDSLFKLPENAPFLPAYFRPPSERLQQGMPAFLTSGHLSWDCLPRNAHTIPA
jgi:hypothetical protein